MSAPGIITIGDAAFYYDYSLAALELSSVLKDIGESAFYNTSNLNSISLPESLTRIGSSAFENSGLLDLNVPSSVNSIGSYAFANSNITNILLGESKLELGRGIFLNCKNLQSATIKSGVETLPVACFEGCVSLNNLILSEGLSLIDDKAFANCTSLESISIPGTVSQIGNTYDYSQTSGVVSSTYFYTQAGKAFPFYNCTSLKKLRFEDGSSAIKLAFARVFDSTQSIYTNSKGLFYYCPLEEIYVGRNIEYTTNITDGYKTTNYTYLSYPERFGYSPFYNNKSLYRVTISNSVTTIPEYLFYKCNSVNVISLALKAPRANTNSFTSYDRSLYFLAGSDDSYTTSTPWSSFLTNYAMYSDGNLIYIPTSDSEAMVSRYPGASPETINIPSSIEFNNKTLSITKVMENSFVNCPDLTLIELPSSITEIGDRAFANNLKLASLTFNGQKIIGKGAFEGCTSITSLTLPNTLEEIRDRAFYGNTAITSVSFGNGLLSIGRESFASCSSLTAARMPNSLENIETSAFENCVKLTYTSLGNSLQKLGDRSFYNCKVLTEIEIPGTTLTVGEQAFEGCLNLSLATLNEGVQKIGGNCFKGCENLVSMSIPGSVQKIGEGAFDDCTMLSSLTFSAGENELWIPYFKDSPIKTLRIGRNLKYSYGDTGSPFRNKTSINRVSFTGNYVTNIYHNLFDGCSGISSLTLPSSLQTINSYAFHNCTGITEIEVPEGVTNIGNNSFENCEALSIVSLPSTLIDIQDYLFHNCISLQSIELKEGITSINSHAFDGCSSLEGLTVPGTTINIGSYAFDGCKSFNKVIFSDSNEEITLDASRSLFRDCPLKTLYVGRNISYDSSNKAYVPFYDQESLENVTFSENTALTAIAPYFIYSAGSVGTILIPDNVMTIGKYAFSECNTLKSIQLSNSLEKIEEGLLKNCDSLESLIIPASVGSVSSYSLGGCSSLKTLRINDSEEAMEAYGASSSKGMCGETALETLYIGRDINYSANSSNGYSPFYGLATLKSVTFTDKDYISNLGDYYFAKCSNVKTLYLPQSITEIGQYGLSDMSSLDYLVFPEKVNILKNNLLDGCCKLPNFTIYPAVSTIEDNVFSNCSSLSTVSFRDNSNNLKIGRKNNNGNYLSLFADSPIETLHLGRWLIYEIGEESWSPFYSQTNLVNLTISDSAGDIGKYLFEKCSSLKTVNIPGVESIGEKAFYECTSLKDVTYNNGTRSLGELSFAECLALDNIKLPSTVVSISDGSFMNCIALNTIDMGSSLEIIGPSVFSGCVNLVNADIPETVYGLGVESFKGCSSLPYINIPSGLSSVGARAFQGCTGAEWLTLSSKVTSLGANSFDGCSSLRYIKSFNTNPPVGVPAFPQNVVDNATVFVPAASLEDYKDADIWWEFFDIRSLTDGKFITYLNLNTTESTLKANETVQLTAEVGPEDATDTSVGFVSDNNDVATVDATGLVTALAVGEANIKAYAKDGSGYYQICKITVDPTLAERIDLSESSMNLRVNRTGVLTALVYPETTTNKEVTWSSSNRGVATIDEEGNITTIYDGVTTLKAEANDGSGVVATCQLTVLAPMTGDSNDNDAVTITDAVNTANYAVGNEVENFNFRAADVNGDSRITLADASGTVTIILEQPVETSAALMKARALMVEDNNDFLVMENFAIKAGQTVSVPVNLDNTVDYVALQADVTVPEGMKIESVTIGNRAASSHSLITKRIDANTVRVVLFDLNNSEFADNNEPLFNINVISDEVRQGEILIGNILASDAQAHEYSLYSTGGNFSDMTAVDSAYTSDIRIEAAENAIKVFNAENQEVAVFATDGTTIARFVAKANIETISVVPGIYVVSAGDNAVKVIVK